MIENFYLRFFNFQGGMSRALQTWVTWDPRNTNDVFLNMIAIGREVGKLVRILFEFNLTDETQDQIVDQLYLIEQ